MEGVLECLIELSERLIELSECLDDFPVLRTTSIVRRSI